MRPWLSGSCRPIFLYSPFGLTHVSHTEQKELDKAYGQFITSLEEVDLIATRAIQKDNEISDEDLKKLTTKCV